MIRKNTVILPEQIVVLRRELLRQYLGTLQVAGYPHTGWGGAEGKEGGFGHFNNDETNLGGCM
jgi:hypothetical protein